MFWAQMHGGPCSGNYELYDLAAYVLIPLHKGIDYRKTQHAYYRRIGKYTLRSANDDPNPSVNVAKKKPDGNYNFYQIVEPDDCCVEPHYRHLEELKTRYESGQSLYFI